MSKVIYQMGGVSADGYTAGPDREFDWARPDETLHRFHNELARGFAGYLLGRRLYETMLFGKPPRTIPRPSHESLR